MKNFVNLSFVYLASKHALVLKLRTKPLQPGFSLQCAGAFTNVARCGTNEVGRDIDNRRDSLLLSMGGRLGSERPKQLALSTAATARVIWLCSCVRYWADRGLVLSVSLAFIVV